MSNSLITPITIGPDVGESGGDVEMQAIPTLNSIDDEGHDSEESEDSEDSEVNVDLIGGSSDEDGIVRVYPVHNGGGGGKDDGGVGEGSSLGKLMNVESDCR